MPAATAANRHARRRAKVFGDGRSMPLDRNAKARIWAYAKAYSARHKLPGQHCGPITQAYQRVLKALLWAFHNAHTGRCFPSYERIAEAAEVSRATVARAIEALEAAGVLTWEHRLVRHQVQLVGGAWTWVLRRTSNAYRFLVGGAESQKAPGTRTQEPSDLPSVPIVGMKVAVAVDNSPQKLNALDAALLRWGSQVAKRHGLGD